MAKSQTSSMLHAANRNEFYQQRKKWNEKSPTQLHTSAEQYLQRKKTEKSFFHSWIPNFHTELFIVESFHFYSFWVKDFMLYMLSFLYQCTNPWWLRTHSLTYQQKQNKRHKTFRISLSSSNFLFGIRCYQMKE